MKGTRFLDGESHVDKHLLGWRHLSKHTVQKSTSLRKKTTSTKIKSQTILNVKRNRKVVSSRGLKQQNATHDLT